MASPTSSRPPVFDEMIERRPFTRSRSPPESGRRHAPAPEQLAAAMVARRAAVPRRASSSRSATRGPGSRAPRERWVYHPPEVDPTLLPRRTPGWPRVPARDPAALPAPAGAAPGTAAALPRRRDARSVESLRRAGHPRRSPRRSCGGAPCASALDARAWIGRDLIPSAERRAHRHHRPRPDPARPAQRGSRSPRSTASATSGCGTTTPPRLAPQRGRTAAPTRPSPRTAEGAGGAQGAEAARHAAERAAERARRGRPPREPRTSSSSAAASRAGSADRRSHVEELERRRPAGALDPGRRRAGPRHHRPASCAGSASTAEAAERLHYVYFEIPKRSAAACACSRAPHQQLAARAAVDPAQRARDAAASTTPRTASSRAAPR